MGGWRGIAVTIPFPCVLTLTNTPWYPLHVLFLLFGIIFFIFTPCGVKTLVEVREGAGVDAMR